ncbi:MAG TPA: molybdopterin-dependent oxidoreductase [Bryobacteraceae bacterium]|nr:molybdopterin-dependent oxidoreductase [Bryobacteraceae bacterium]
MTRRQLLLLPGIGSLLGQEQVLSTSESQNFTFPLEGVAGSVTPIDRFFIRDHFREPELSLSTWRLKIEGRVEHPMELTLSDILESRTMILEAVLECAGSPPDGSAASNAVWEGVPIERLLQQAGVAPDARAVLLEGADSGKLMKNSPELPYCQVVSLDKCLQPESLVAFRLNGQLLPRRSGFPARALFPGWYGMDSVKWLQRIVVLGPGDAAPNFEASGMNKLYNRLVKQPNGEVNVTRLTEVSIKSAIAFPADHSKLLAGQHVIRGFAWTGSGLVQRVDVSADAGSSWKPAEFEAAPKRFTWARWRFLWNAVPGEHVLMSRATGDTGSQPIKRDPARKDGYEMNYCLPVHCTVR